MTDNDFEAALTTTLRRHAGRPADTASLLHEASARGRALARRRRRSMVTAAAAGAVMALAGATLVVSVIARPATTPADQPGSELPPPLPAAAGEPGAVQRPDLVATDPAVLHFTWDLPANTSLVQWEITPSYEEGWVVLAERPGLAAGGVRVGVGRDLAALEAADTTNGLEFSGPPVTEPTTVGGRPAQRERQPLAGSSGNVRWVLRWQPVDGLWARIGALGDHDLSDVMGYAAGLHLDRAQRCVVPYRLGVGPPNASAIGCMVRLGRELGVGTSDPEVAVIVSALYFADGQGNMLTVSTHQTGRMITRPNRTVAGRPAEWSPPDAGAEQPGSLTFEDFDGLSLSIVVQGDWDEQTVVGLAEHVAMAADLNDPSSWVP